MIQHKVQHLRQIEKQVLDFHQHLMVHIGGKNLNVWRRLEFNMWQVQLLQLLLMRIRIVFRSNNLFKKPSFIYTYSTSSNSATVKALVLNAGAPGFNSRRWHKICEPGCITGKWEAMTSECQSDQCQFRVLSYSSYIKIPIFTNYISSFQARTFQQVIRKMKIMIFSSLAHDHYAILRT